MALSPLDIAVIVAFFAVNLGIGLWFARGSGKNIGEYFLSGRSAPWWLTGTSMVATTFAVDTALGRAHRRRVHRAALRREAGVGAARRARRVPGRDRQHDHHGLGQPGDGEDSLAHAPRSDAAGALSVLGAHGAVRHDR